jgi:2-keto-4-pentenoate hydratase/2-oxohepta-3-ene-1,7-dioic acid hydratase in catechol pathway
VKLLRFSTPDGTERFGIYSKGEATDLSSSYAGFAEFVTDLRNLRIASTAGDTKFKVGESGFLPPADRRSKILCMAVNYHSHIREMHEDQTQEPILFAKFFTSLTGPYNPIPRFTISQIMDYEGELAVVIGSSAKNVRREEAWEHVAGFTLVNDMSARSLFKVPQGDGIMKDWFSCKAIDHSTPVGPWIVTPDEAGDFTTLRVETFLNGTKVQSGSASDMVFDVPKIIEHVSSRLTLESGDIISTGTPSGVGVSRKRTLEKGDTIRVQAEGVGHLENRIV